MVKKSSLPRIPALEDFSLALHLSGFQQVAENHFNVETKIKLGGALLIEFDFQSSTRVHVVARRARTLQKKIVALTIIEYQIEGTR